MEQYIHPLYNNPFHTSNNDSFFLARYVSNHFWDKKIST
jgi:hypothetical protein